MSVWQQGATIQLTIDSLSHTGEGVGRWQDRVVFVADTVPGDRLRVRLTHVKRQYAHGKVLEVVQPSEQRVRPSCIVADKCGGCQWQCVAYGAQLAAKEQLVKDAIARIAHLEPQTFLPIVAAPNPFGYRNKVTYPLGRRHGTVVAGYYQKGSHHLVNLNQCPVQDPRLNPLLAALKQALQPWPIYNEQTHEPGLRHLGLRIGQRTGEQLITLVLAGALPAGLQAETEGWLQQFQGVVGVCVNFNHQVGNRIFGDETQVLAGRSYLWEEMAGVRFQIASTTFFQVNTAQAEQLVSTLREWIAPTGHERLLDLYCGVGTLSLPLAGAVAEVIGVEVHPASVQQAIANAQHNGIHNAHFLCARAEEWLPQSDQAVDVLILDPPRKGCDRPLLEAILRHRPPRILYVSCHPATLARDLAHLCATGAYQLTKIQPLDMFPQTAHVETVALLTTS
ncbi:MULTISPECIES: 23S rRNA (uracil(1939)-C(5))-methyltransferase RlmD [unclassified Thermosynechococcus]|uniref:23S rRNA (uracil(1939)-C(5))-methyltransferase RlmD n=1 Tax=unclassified Thermosynechococcus TaxID=2622553 RepID=UPI002673C590|nr:MULTISPECIES: 23S rRNA (uracil(1939)-C(5))-methyltransferase RlmD [unclassified Thermosynechococcus]WKT83969.1 23S rRNA (uracil(1939)-C(5))-methyltransferase RlmD [Thermosynechococcus sp. HY596]WNC63103.1 23S rRNA (uracil(1939)-C(5))-methyltransferase RlmD [Thermosynechococcus sp. HY591]WNC65662.1 23S rRNA (uracil(1939)-C(5))-methyltransferase RlmD [Thermosynechococcus sp. HY593]